MRENMDQNNSEYGHFSRSAWLYKEAFIINKNKLFRKILNSKVTNMEPCDTLDNTSRKLL